MGDHGLLGWICSQLWRSSFAGFRWESKFKCVTFINVCLGASAHRALSTYIHYASRLVCDLVCWEEPRAQAAQQAVAVTASPQAMTCSLRLEFCHSYRETVLNGLFQNQIFKKGYRKYKIYNDLFNLLTKSTFPQELGFRAGEGALYAYYLCILAVHREPWFISKPGRFHYFWQTLEIFFKAITCLLFYVNDAAYLVCVWCVCVC